MRAWERSWNGMMIRSTELEYQQIIRQQVTGVFLKSSEFNQGQLYKVNFFNFSKAGRITVIVMTDPEFAT